MWRVPISLCLLALTCCVQAAEPDANRTLRAALLCEVDPLDAVQALAASGSSAFDAGYAGYEIGEEIDTKSIVLLRAPITIEGAVTHAVIGGPTPQFEDFEGLVSARFTGNAQAVATALRLTPGGDGGQLSRAMETDPADGEDVVCPMTIHLKTLEDGAFLLGCGWCNG